MFTALDFFSIDPFNWQAIGTAILCGTIVGLERQLRGKPVGIRTSTLITLGTYIFIAASFSTNTQMTDPSRVIGQVITGIGFLGAGVILAKDGIVLGVTSAAAIWALSSVGVCISTGAYATSIKLAVIVVLILAGVDVLEDSFAIFTRGVHKKFRAWRNLRD